MTELGKDLTELVTFGGGEWFDFKEIGDQISGIIIHAEDRQVREFQEDGKGPLATWDDGSPKMGIFLTLRLESGEEVNIHARKYALDKAIKKAVQISGKPFTSGSKLSIKRVEDVPSKKGKPAHAFKAKYEYQPVEKVFDIETPGAKTESDDWDE